MFPEERRKKIVNLLNENGMMKLPELTKILQISMETLRRDVQQLVKEEKVKKIYGGIQKVENNQGESLIEHRMQLNLEAKKKIAAMCRNLINEGECIYLDSGSTTLQIAECLKGFENLTIITNSIPIISMLASTKNDIICIGGKLRHSEQSITTFDFLFNFEQLNIQKAFICSSGITVEKGISDYNLEEANTRRSILSLAEEVIVTSDASKFGRDVTVQVCPLDAVDKIVTDDGLSNSYIKQFDHVSTELIISSAEE